MRKYSLWTHPFIYLALMGLVCTWYIPSMFNWSSWTSIPFLIGFIVPPGLGVTWSGFRKPQGTPGRKEDLQFGEYRLVLTPYSSGDVVIRVYKGAYPGNFLERFTTSKEKSWRRLPDLETGVFLAQRLIHKKMAEDEALVETTRLIQSYRHVTNMLEGPP